MEISRDSALTALVRVRVVNGSSARHSGPRTQHFRGALGFASGGVVGTDTQRRARHKTVGQAVKFSNYIAYSHF
jgi:hypothetical protein